MHIKSVEFAGAIGQIGQGQPESINGLRQVAFAGRSNVGKSSLINRVLGRTRSPIARVSQQPGKTQEINFYHVRTDVGEFCLVDLPGYGYAKVPKELRERWRPLISGFLSSNEALAGVVQLIDMRHGPTEDDLRAIAYLAEVGVGVLFALTKSDKLKPSERQRAFATIEATLKADTDQVIAVSALSGDGIEALLQSLSAVIAPAQVTEEPYSDG
ncbi:ribosome biogenesis GTP-binding protein YihA/YsxC [soil metagenome]